MIVGMLILFMGLIMLVKFKLVCMVIIWLVSMNVFSIIMEIKLMVMLMSNCWIFSKNIFILIRLLIGDGGIIGMIISDKKMVSNVWIGVGIDLVLMLIMVVNMLFICIKGSIKLVRNWLMVISEIFI